MKKYNLQFGERYIITCGLGTFIGIVYDPPGDGNLVTIVVEDDGIAPRIPPPFHMRISVDSLFIPATRWAVFKYKFRRFLK